MRQADTAPGRRITAPTRAVHPPIPAKSESPTGAGTFGISAPLCSAPRSLLNLRPPRPSLAAAGPGGILLASGSDPPGPHGAKPYCLCQRACQPVASAGPSPGRWPVQESLPARPPARARLMRPERRSATAHWHPAWAQPVTSRRRLGPRRDPRGPSRRRQPAAAEPSRRVSSGTRTGQPGRALANGRRRGPRAHAHPGHRDGRPTDPAPAAAWPIRHGPQAHFAVTGAGCRGQ